VWRDFVFSRRLFGAIRPGDAATVPEPSTAVLLGTGVPAMLVVLRRRRLPSVRLLPISLGFCKVVLERKTRRLPSAEIAALKLNRSRFGQWQGTTSIQKAETPYFFAVSLASDNTGDRHRSSSGRPS
jgi:hypothetical protein